MTNNVDFNFRSTTGLNFVTKFIEEEVIPYMKLVIGEELWPYIEEYGVIAGGCIRDHMLFTAQQIKDIDLFFKRDSHNFIKSIYKDDVEWNKRNVFDFSDITKAEETFHTITLSRSKKILKASLKSIPIQLILNFTDKNAEDIINRFDVNICKMAYDLKSKKLLIPAEVISDIFSNDHINLSVRLMPIEKMEEEGVKIAQLKLSKQAGHTLKRLISIMSKASDRPLKLKEYNIGFLIKEMIKSGDSDTIDSIIEGSISYEDK